MIFLENLFAQFRFIYIFAYTDTIFIYLKINNYEQNRTH